MNANTIRLAIVALLIAGGLSTACRLTSSASPAPAQNDTVEQTSKVCHLGRAC